VALLAGQFSALGRCRAALRSRLFFYATLLGAAACALLFLQLPGAGAGLLSAVAGGGGLLLLALLLGQGMVALPRALWTLAPSDEWRRSLAYGLAVVDAEHRARARALEDCLQHVDAVVRLAPPPPRAGDVRRRETLLELAALALSERAPAAGGASLTTRLCGALPTLAVAPTGAGLARHHHRLRVAFAAERAAWRRRERCLERACALRAALSATERGFGGAAVPARRGLWLGALRQPALRAASLGLGLLSALQLWGAASCGLTGISAQPSLCEERPAPLRALLLVHAALCTAFALARSRMLTHLPLRFPRPDGRALLQTTAWSLRLAAPLVLHVLHNSSRGGAERDPLGGGGSHYYHGLCALLTLAAAAVTARGCFLPLRLLPCARAEQHAYPGRSRSRQVEQGEAIAGDAVGGDDAPPGAPRLPATAPEHWLLAAARPARSTADDEAEAAAAARARWLELRGKQGGPDQASAPATPAAMAATTPAETEEAEGGGPTAPWPPAPPAAASMGAPGGRR